MTPDICELLTRAGIYDVMDILFLSSGPNVFTVKMIDMIEFQALGAVSGHEADGAASGFEDMTSICNGLIECTSVSGEYAHTLCCVRYSFGIETFTFCFPMFYGFEGLGLRHFFWAEFAEEADDASADIDTSNIDLMSGLQHFHGKGD